ncbi:MAG: molybdenum cofactor biosynthesis protein MoaE [Gammaproteobacteria bacterium]|nr:MAG: molybdenum cofactor biosynthesis protein MoaE [Gammaproteobacteria bacterium]
MRIELRTETFDPWQELRAHEAQMSLAGDCGATAVFVGSMRDFNAGDKVEGLYLEHYPGMTERQLHTICEAAAGRWTLRDVLVLHRVGEIRVGEAIVLVCVRAAHRGDAFDACRAIMEELKHTAPFWKKEKLQDRGRWVEGNTDGYAVKERN